VGLVYKDAASTLLGADGMEVKSWSLNPLAKQRECSAPFGPNLAQFLITRKRPTDEKCIE